MKHGIIWAGTLAAALLSLAGCNTKLTVKAHTRDIVEAADSPNQPNHIIVLQVSIEAPSNDVCQWIADGVPQRAKAYGLDVANNECVRLGSENFVQFSANVQMKFVENKQGEVNATLPANTLFGAFVTKTPVTPNSDNMAYVLMLNYNQPLFASLQKDLTQENALYSLDVSETKLSLDLENDLDSNKRVQISSAFVWGDPDVSQKDYILTPGQSVNVIYSDVHAAEFEQNGHMVLASVYTPQ